MLGIIINTDPLIGAKRNEFSVKECINGIAFKMGIHNILGKCKDREHVTARIIAIYLIRKNTRMNLKQIGVIFNRNHSTIIYNLRQYDALVQTKDKYFMSCLKKVRC
jgi:chromosomal replication initiation ATPase DnaA